MGVAESQADDGLRSYLRRPTVLLLAVACLYLLVDLLAKLGGVRIAPGGIHLIGGEIPVANVVGFLMDGLILGLIIALAGVGLSMTYSILGFANFAHGDYLTAGAFSGWAAAYVVALFTLDGLDVTFGEVILLNAPSLVSAWTSPFAVLVGFIVAAVVSVVLVLGLDRAVYRPMRDKGSISLLIASIGVALALRYLIVFVWSPSTRGVTSTNPESLPSMDLFGIYTLNLHEGIMIVVAVGLMLGVHLLLQYTKLGKAMRAMSDNKALAQVTGIPTERVVRATWVIGGGLAGVAGFLIILERGVLSFNFGWRLLLFIFSGVILGGIGSVYGAIGGGIIIGVASRIALVWLPSGFPRVAAFGVMILVLLYRPAGLFGGVTTA
ncbi:branched-chain amino acid ABC transporter permease [Haloglomus salinum]|jgi:branched-chain amino acid transport system permease protein|uniref:branched-chain amino acid ABC transporter permease n=1 Tax=Haloglomus salinum TaxID=2962673 RepID=UPI0020C99567|nr:branched-chain amino acid ABC transporter permease [Haloglomus salinum]